MDISSRSPADADVFSSNTSSEIEFSSSSSYSGIPSEVDLVRSLKPPSQKDGEVENKLLLSSFQLDRALLGRWPVPLKKSFCNSVKGPTFPAPVVQQQVQQDFFKVARFPAMVGALGCTHIAIRCPQLHPNLYLGFYSMWIPRTEIMARLPGSFSCSHVCSKYIFAHSGYPLHKWLLPPLQNPPVDAEVRYNKALLRSHRVAAKTVGLLKACFPCLERSITPLQYFLQL
ncbi:hypothetical protein AAFF_G00086650 [Aldrovandia affinis]|uniref:Uncharacterized protein n=1 Tax=Aldrovandia affinis TaxID=143900 RepID=A0AAD7RWU7_9TELE|nr:hypothetical protein AAFF_G00086650 [Aldrovandia affinis]